MVLKITSSFMHHLYGFQKKARVSITFTPLSESHFPLLLKWLNAPHVKQWWDLDVLWTPALIQQKYKYYVKGYKIENGQTKPINAYIICVDNKPVGYIQIYNAYDFSRSQPLQGLPSKCAAIDIFIGEESFLRRGIGSYAIKEFLNSYNPSYTPVFVDPDKENVAAIHAYEKAGFKKVNQDANKVWMIKDQLTEIIYQRERSLLSFSVRTSKEALNKLIADDFVEFGASGKIYNKQDVLDSLPSETARTYIIKDFKVKELGEDAALATYKIVEDGMQSLRSSIWKKINGDFRMIFHQGTRSKD